MILTMLIGEASNLQQNIHEIFVVKEFCPSQRFFLGTPNALFTIYP